MEKYTNALLESKKWNNHLGFHLSLFQGLVQSTIAAMILSILFLGGNMVLDGKMTGEELLHYFTTTQASQKAFDNLGIMFGQAVKIHGITTRLTEYINYDNHIPFQGGIRPIEFKGNIEFVNASFVYPSRPDHPVLNNFNLEIPAGKVLAVCGQSGSGKSTLGQVMKINFS